MIGQSAMTRTGSGHYVRQALLAASRSCCAVMRCGDIMALSASPHRSGLDSGNTRHTQSLNDSHPV